MKLKDAQMRRLQTKVRDFIKMEQELKTKIKEVTERDQKLINELETATCFGKVLFTIKPTLQVIQKNIEKTLLSDYRKEYNQREEKLKYE